ncbi:MAG: deoxynucleoside kinase [Flavobacteriales bacterium]|jgi:deoxyadenosine/deoxycytidine kinase|nr:deoxynucleoside kinase [Flavobacteriales bacterium]MBT5273221.1 deoxynucleoside kinase [Flavobacteriales bacterium]MBT5614629.1 deoxynucleoside kinase [Flavobacteriales bacterium]MBT6650294.1 deoxynucleoside kinase [Flavobacteriales bacterium]MBT6965395.1 deoxynucleoside kinase [Flavobacteriales bacterium]
MLYSHIAIEGNIGSGKTTLATMLANDMDARLVLEQFADNPFLPKFYSDPEKHAFPLELFFMAERYHQLKNLKEQDLFKPQIVSDYFFVKSKLFAQNNLKKDEMQLFNRLFDIMLSSLSKPDLLVYLYSDVERLQQNIKNRGRDFEQNISDEYLQNIQDKYLDFLRKQSDFPVLLLDVTNVDFVTDKNIYDKIGELIFVEYSVGVTNEAL